MATRPRKAKAETPENEIGGARGPRRSPFVMGHDDVTQMLAGLIDRDRLPHGILLTGEPGVGKATLAYAIARRLLADPSEVNAGLLAIDPEGTTVRQVAASSHPGLYVVEAERDPRTQRLRPIVVESIRDMSGFLHHTASGGGWRVVIFDGAEQMNANAANALLKLLEEPPARAALVLVCGVPARMPRTIASRCVRFHLSPLAEEDVARIVMEQYPEVEQQQAITLARRAAGSAGRAMLLASKENLELQTLVSGMLDGLPKLDVAALHDLADKVGRAGAEAAYDQVMDQLLAWTADAVRGAARGEGGALGPLSMGPLDAWAGLWEKISAARRQADFANLDRRQVVLQAILDLRRGLEHGAP